MARIPTDNRLPELDDGRTIGYATWGDPEGMPVLIGHGTPGSRLALAPGLDDPEWIRQQRLLFVGVDRPGYGYSDPWAEASPITTPATVKIFTILSSRDFTVSNCLSGASLICSYINWIVCGSGESLTDTSFPCQIQA